MTTPVAYKGENFKAGRMQVIITQLINTSLPSAETGFPIRQEEFLPESTRVQGKVLWRRRGEREQRGEDMVLLLLLWAVHVSERTPDPQLSRPGEEGARASKSAP